MLQTTVSRHSAADSAEIAHVLIPGQSSGYGPSIHLEETNYPEAIAYLLSARRIDWLFHCYDPNNRDRCLELGDTRWGSMSFLLSKFFEEVIVQEGDTFHRITSRKHSQERRTEKVQAQRSIGLVRAGLLNLPFSDEEFNLVVANGLLEQLAFRPKSDPRSILLRLFRETRRCLRDGGCLYIWTERGVLSELLHFMGSNVLRDQDSARHRTPTYSLLAYKSLLRAAGFGPVELYWAYPSCHSPEIAARLEDGNAYSVFAQQSLRSAKSHLNSLKLLMGTLVPPTILGKICPHIWKNVLIFAWKAFKPKTIEDAVRDAVGATSLIRSSGLGKVIFVGLENKKVRSFTKLLRFPREVDLETAEELQTKYARISTTKHRFGKISFFSERAVSGRHYNPGSMEDSQAAVRWLLQFQEKTSSEPLTQGEVEIELKQLCACKETLDEIGELFDILVSTGVPKCSEHGDFYPYNILVSDAEGLVVLDWETCRTKGNPLFDLCSLIIGTSYCKEPDLENSFLRNLSGCGPRSRIISQAARMFCSYKGLPLRAVVLGIPYALSRIVARDLAGSETVDRVRHYRLWEPSRLLRVWNESVRYSDFSWLA